MIVYVVVVGVGCETERVAAVCESRALAEKYERDNTTQWRWAEIQEWELDGSRLDDSGDDW